MMFKRAEFIRGLHNLAPRHRGCVATIGNFDGVHLGHRAVVAQLQEKARALDLPSVVILFEPQPLEFFRPHAAPGRLMRVRDKVRVLETLGIDRVLCIHFDSAFAAMSAEDFVRKVLVEGLDVRYLVIGDDFRFGAGRKGDFGTLGVAAGQYGFHLAATETTMLDGERISSTRIREALSRSDFNLVQRLLGRPYGISGHVAHGNKLGRTLGVPTANIHLRRLHSPIAGIYVAQVEGLGERPLPGVASLGTRPTVGGTTLLLEVHLFDFDRDIYGKAVTVNFLSKLRDEKRFGSLEELKAAMGVDIAAARAYFAR
jgi:riboflavin kinase/FMN adenylyltransferase